MVFAECISSNGSRQYYVSESLSDIWKSTAANYVTRREVSQRSIHLTVYEFTKALNSINTGDKKCALIGVVD